MRRRRGAHLWEEALAVLARLLSSAWPAKLGLCGRARGSARSTGISEYLDQQCGRGGSDEEAARGEERFERRAALLLTWSKQQTQVPQSSRVHAAHLRQRTRLHSPR